MPKFAKKKDLNQPEIETELRGLGFSVQSLHELGKGVPDLLLGIINLNFIVEVKHDTAALTPQEVEWHKDWQGQVRVGQSTEEIVRAFATYAQDMKRKMDAVTEYCDLALAKMKRVDDD